MAVTIHLNSQTPYKNWNGQGSETETPMSLETALFLEPKGQTSLSSATYWLRLPDHYSALQSQSHLNTKKGNLPRSLCWGCSEDSYAWRGLEIDQGCSICKAMCPLSRNTRQHRWLSSNPPGTCLFKNTSWGYVEVVFSIYLSVFSSFIKHMLRINLLPGCEFL